MPSVIHSPVVVFASLVQKNRFFRNLHTFTLIVMIFTCQWSQRHLSQTGRWQMKAPDTGAEGGGYALPLLFQTWRPRGWGLGWSLSEASSGDSTQGILAEKFHPHWQPQDSLLGMWDTSPQPLQPTHFSLISQILPSRLPTGGRPVD